MDTFQDRRYTGSTQPTQETFLQRQRRLEGQQAKPAPTGSVSGGTPVTGTGKIPEPQAFSQVMPSSYQSQPRGGVPQYQPPAPAQPTQPVIQPAQNVPQAPNTGPVQSPTQPLQPLQLGNDKFATYAPTQFNVPVPQLGNVPESYGGSTFSQFAGPNQQQTQGLETGLVNRLLASPESLSPEVLAALKERQKEGALLMERQGMQGAREAAAARGLTSGGTLGGAEAAMRGETNANILRSNRDLDVAAAQTNMQDRLNALSAAEGVLSGGMGRATQGYGATLAGQSAQAEDTRNVSQDAIQRALGVFGANLEGSKLDLQQQGMSADERFRGFTSERSAQDAALQRILSQFGMNQAATDWGLRDKGLNIQNELGQGGLAIDRQRLAQQGSQFDKGYGLDVLRFLEGQNQFGQNMDFNYDQLGLQGQNQLFNFINGIL